MYQHCFNSAPLQALFKIVGFNFKWCRISSGLSTEFWFSDCSLKLWILRDRWIYVIWLIVTDGTKFLAWELSVNRHKIIILFIKLTAGLITPSFATSRYRIWGKLNDYLIFSPSSVLSITLGVIILQCGRKFCMKVWKLRILSSTEDSFAQLLVPIYTIIVSVNFFNKSLRYWSISSTDAPGKGRTFTGYFVDSLFLSMPDINRNQLWFWGLILDVII